MQNDNIAAEGSWVGKKTPKEEGGMHTTEGGDGSWLYSVPKFWLFFCTGKAHQVGASKFFSWIFASVWDVETGVLTVSFFNSNQISFWTLVCWRKEIVSHDIVQRKEQHKQQLENSKHDLLWDPPNAVWGMLNSTAQAFFLWHTGLTHVPELCLLTSAALLAWECTFLSPFASRASILSVSVCSYNAQQHTFCNCFLAEKNKEPSVCWHYPGKPH